MPYIEIFCGSRFQIARDVAKEIGKRISGLSFRDKIVIVCMDSHMVQLISTSEEQNCDLVIPNPFIRVWSISEKFLREIEEALKDLPCEIHFVLMEAFKPTDSTEIQHRCS